MQEAQAPKLDTFSDTAAALANLCISVHYGKLNLMLLPASKSQKITFILMKCTKTVATRAAPFGPDMHQIVCRLGLLPRPHWGSLQRSPRPPSWFRGWDPPGKGKRGEGKGGEGLGGIGTPPPGTGREGKGMEGRMGVGG